MARLRITGVRFDEVRTHERITHVFGPVFGEKPAEEVVRDIESGSHSYYVRPSLLRRGVTVWVVHPPVSARDRRVHIRTHANGVYTNSLLVLPVR